MNKLALASTVLLLGVLGCQVRTDVREAARQSAAAGGSGSFGVSVRGNRFVSTADGSTLELIGANISGLETGQTSRWPQFAAAGPAFWSKVRNWGGQPINTVRLPLNEASWLNYTCYDPGAGSSASHYGAAKDGGYTPDPRRVYQSIVKRAVADATAAGLYVILDLHWGAPNNPAGQALCPIGQPSYADRDHSLEFWKQVADTFKDNPAVLFELFNEPYGTNIYGNWVTADYQPGPDAIMARDGGSYSPFIVQENGDQDAMLSYDFAWQVAGMQAMLDTIRRAGATNVILSAPIGWAGEIETWLATRPIDPLDQLGVAWHIYKYKKGTAPPLAVLAAGYPIVITETYGLEAIDGYMWAASHNIGYLWWGWNDWRDQPLGQELSQPPWFHSTAP